MVFIDKERTKAAIRKYADTKYNNGEQIDYVNGILKSISVINEQPTADVEEVKHGEWLDNIKVISTVGMTDIKALVGYRCSVCGREEVAKEPYCNCGAKMDR